jgi:hypothetical protein
MRYWNEFCSKPFTTETQRHREKPFETARRRIGVAQLCRKVLRENSVSLCLCGEEDFAHAGVVQKPGGRSMRCWNEFRSKPFTTETQGHREKLLRQREGE